MEQNTPYGPAPEHSQHETYTPPSQGMPPQAGYPMGYNPRTNVYAIVSLICAFVFSPLAVVFGHLSMKQIAATGEQGRGMAIAGLVIGYVGIAAVVAYFVLIVVVVGAMGGMESVTGGPGGIVTIDELGRRD